ncbi:hypothetical protein EHP00_1664 [Ecytonucleospora hepatopenaei]|uniref:Uncharacterized protein n=1 Tax=Ecytonucleospora hepatopenaei TaxID=646526 RepID=A0A1W0E304_9MICR|nr:hypothetical protein EHP00_1664 [Ecytonucleospora hepatopenaei]
MFVLNFIRMFECSNSTFLSTTDLQQTHTPTTSSIPVTTSEGYDVSPRYEPIPPHAKKSINPSCKIKEDDKQFKVDLRKRREENIEKDKQERKKNNQPSTSYDTVDK